MAARSGQLAASWKKSSSYWKFSFERFKKILCHL